jgi:DNA-binding CsgD family transcriptional regulator
MASSSAPHSDSERQLAALERLLQIEAAELRPALDEATLIVAEVLGSEKCDVLLYEEATDTLVAMGTSNTPMGREQRRAGLDRYPLANGAPPVAVFRTGHPYLTGQADQDPTQPRGCIERLGIRSELDVPLDVAGERRGVLLVSCTQVDRFTETDLAFLQAVARWIGMVTYRTELFERVQAVTYQQGRQAGAAELLSLLTPRQQEVVALIMAGLSNRQIAERLVVSEGTVANHVRAILDRLGAERRGQVTAWLTEGRSLQPDDAEARSNGQAQLADGHTDGHGADGRWPL